MNTEARDHLNFLKGALDIISNSTTADTSNTMYLRILRASAAVNAYEASVTADAQMRFIVSAGGQLEWGSGAAARDVNLYRNGADQLKTDDRLDIGTGITLGPVPGVIELTENASVAVASTNNARVYCEDNGAGKTRLMVRFQTGVGQVLATEP